MYERDSGSGFAMGIISGVLVGAGVALLLAPKAGTDLRGDLGQTVGNVRDNLARRLHELADRVSAELDSFQVRVDRASDSAAGAVYSAADTASAAAERAREQVDDWAARVPSGSRS
ncbi:MAG: YtxH domain-containing protein [Vicinamibacterales bacterium]